MCVSGSIALYFANGPVVMLDFGFAVSSGSQLMRESRCESVYTDCVAIA